MEVGTKKGAAESVVRNPELTHGTMGCRSLGPTRKFYEEELRLRCVQHAPVAQLVAGSCEFGIACVKAGDKLPGQGQENHWVIAASDAETVAMMHAGLASSDFVAELGPLSSKDGVTNFMVQNGDGVWWNVTNLTEDHYHALFEKGDVVI